MKLIEFNVETGASDTLKKYFHYASLLVQNPSAHKRFLRLIKKRKYRKMGCGSSVPAVDPNTEYLVEEVKEHDCVEKGVWIIMDKKVYDVTKYLNEHPGGAEIILGVAGTDATSDFILTPRHSFGEADKIKELFVIGKIVDEKSS